MSGFKNFILTFFVAAVIFGLIAFGIVKFSDQALSIGGDQYSPETGAPGEVSKMPDNEDRDLSSLTGNSFTMLFVGTDYLPSVFKDYSVSPGAVDKDGFPARKREINADLIIVVRVDKDTGNCVTCAVPSETRISMGGLTMKLGELYSKKGVSTLADKVSALTGLPVDYYAVISAEQFKGLINAMGSVTYYVSTTMNYVNEELGMNISLKKGSQKLNGQKALDMLRFPAYSDGEISRRKCAVSFLQKLFQTWLLNSNESKAADLYNKYIGYFDACTLTLQDVTANADLIFSYSRMNQISYTYPGSATVIDGENYFAANVSVATDYFSKYKYQG
ncbi:MAG: LCP family protein [Clostridia bacterium]|nr:LCP family protein [Clostridia bacterium]